jgi:beta-galactosidase GanA
MLRAIELNTVETYVPWSCHEPRAGTFARLDELEFFLTEAERTGLHAIVRPGPNICAESDNGGLPYAASSNETASPPARSSSSVTSRHSGTDPSTGPTAATGRAARGCPTSRPLPDVGCRES